MNATQARIGRSLRRSAFAFPSRRILVKSIMRNKRPLIVTLSAITSGGFVLAACQTTQPVSPSNRGDEVPHNEMRQREPQWISGHVMGVDQIPIEHYNDSTIHLRVTTDENRDVDLELGPGWYITERGLVFEPHQQIQFRGQKNPAGDTFVAHQLRHGQQTIELRNDDGTPKWPAKATPTSPSASAPGSASPRPDAE